jgi:hypothetical protein
LVTEIGRGFVREELPTPIERVWGLVRGFRDLSAWAPDGKVTSVEGDGVGAIRRVESPLGLFVERCEAHDEAARRFSYAILESRAPFRSYVAVIQPEDRGSGRCGIEWSCDFEAEPEQEQTLVQVVEATYRNGFIASLRRSLEADTG